MNWIKSVHGCFYLGAKPFQIFKDPYFIDYVNYVANSCLSGNIPQSYNRLRDSLLVQVRSNIENLMDVFKRSLDATRVSIVSDGWTNVQRRPLINFMAVLTCGAMFLKVVDASRIYKNPTYMSKLFL